MYVDDMTLEEAWDIERELTAQLGMSQDVGDGSDEQVRWDLEDVHRRIQELDPTEGTQ